MSPDDARASTGSAPAANLLPVRYGLRLVTTTSVLTGALLAMTAVSGLLLGTRGLYRPDPATLPTFVGQDAITLFAALPLLVASIQTATNGSLRGLLLWAAGLFYIAYSYAYYGAAGISMILADLSRGKMPSRVDQVVWPMDPVVAFPAMFWAGLWLWRRQPLGYVVVAVLLVKAGLPGVALAVNTWIATTFWNSAADPMVPVNALDGCGGLALAGWYLSQIGRAHV